MNIYLELAMTYFQLAWAYFNLAVDDVTLALHYFLGALLCLLYLIVEYLPFLLETPWIIYYSTSRIIKRIFNYVKVKYFYGAPAPRHSGMRDLPIQENGLINEEDEFEDNSDEADQRDE